MQRKPIQVNLDDTAALKGVRGSATNCRPAQQQQPQFKILRRPKPADNNNGICANNTTNIRSNSNNLDNQIGTNSQSRIDMFSDSDSSTLFDMSTNRTTNNHHSNPNTRNLNLDHGQLNNHQKNFHNSNPWSNNNTLNDSQSLQQPTFASLITDLDSAKTTTNRLDDFPSMSTSSSSLPFTILSSNSHQSSKQPAILLHNDPNGHHQHAASMTTAKKPIKTYQERADEYAKARLRILGSPSSDLDQL